MTAIERALVVYAEAKGYEVERQSRGQIEKWELLEQPIGFNFAFNRYRLRDPGNMHKVCNSLYAEYLPNIPEKSISEMVENIKKFKPAGFSCKSGLEEVSELLEKNNVKIGINSDPNIIPNYDNFINDFVEEDLVRPKESPLETDSPEVRERYAKVTPFIMLMEAWAEGEKDIEFAWKSESSPKWIKTDDPYWNFGVVIYRAVPKTKQPEAIPATEEELEYMGLRGKWFWIKDKKTGKMDKSPRLLVDVYDGLFYIFNPVSNTWQDWSSK